MNYSQHNEQQVILDYFKNQNPEDLCFLDCGANDGITFSNTHALSLAGWNGVCIEPSSTFQSLKRLYYRNPKVLCFNLAITLKDGPVILHESGPTISDTDHGLLSSLIFQETLKWKHNTEFVEKQVNGVCWNSFREIYVDSTYHFISIDCEGSDLEILFQMHLSGLECKLLCIEWGQNEAVKNAIHHYVSKFGMKLIYSNETNLIYGL